MKNYLPKQYKKTTKLKINHNYLFEQFADYSKIFKEIEKVVKRGDYTLGQKVNEFEKNFAKRTGAKFVISVGNGTDALYLSLKALNIGKGDEVITVPYTFISTVGSIVTAGAKPVFVDINEDYNFDEKKIEELIQYSKRKENIEINLTEQEIIFGNKRIKFEIDPFKKKCLLYGLDDIALSLEKSEKISSYENKLEKNKPWIN